MAACIHIWFLAISVLKKIVKYKVKRKREKQGNIQLFDIYFVKSVTFVFFHRLPVGITALWPQQLSMKITISLLIVFFAK